MTISMGDMAGQIIIGLVTAFGGVFTAFACHLMWRIADHFGIKVSAEQRAVIEAKASSAILHAINLAAVEAVRSMAGKGPVAIRSATVAGAVQFIQQHHADDMAPLGINTLTQGGVDRLKARIETTITDPSAPTPKVLDVADDAAVVSASQAPAKVGIATISKEGSR